MVKERKNQRLIDAHHAFWPDEAAMAEGSPQLLLDRGEAVQLPPVLLLQGTNDDNLPADSADRFAAAYAKRGGQIHVEKFPGEPHTFVSRDPNSDASRKALAMMVAFVKQHTGRA
jgi:dipeptidyl aminopeptidase/acylaminoacyl peptidase